MVIVVLGTLVGARLKPQISWNNSLKSLHRMVQKEEEEKKTSSKQQVLYVGRNALLMRKVKEECPVWLIERQQ